MDSKSKYLALRIYFAIYHLIRDSNLIFLNFLYNGFLTLKKFPNYRTIVEQTYIFWYFKNYLKSSIFKNKANATKDEPDKYTDSFKWKNKSKLKNIKKVFFLRFCPFNMKIDKKYINEVPIIPYAKISK